MKNNDINFEYVEDFANYIVERAVNDEDLFLTVVGKFEEIKNIIKEMMVIADVDFEKIILFSPEDNDYTDEYVLDCWCDDGVIQIGCVPAKRDGKYLNLFGDETYLFDNCPSKIIPLCEGSKLYFVSIEDECDCDDCCKGEPYVLNVKLNLDTDEAEKIIRKYRNDFYKEIAIFKELLDF